MKCNFILNAMRVYFSTVTLVFAIGFNFLALAKDGLYITANIGSSFKSKGSDYINGTRLDASFVDHLNYGAGVGYNIGSISADVTYTHFDTKVIRGRTDVRSNFILFNGYYNFNLFNGLMRPYVGAGIGFAISSVNTINLKNAFGYQAVVGSRFKITESLSLFSDFRYTSALKAGYKAVDHKIESSLHFFSTNVGLSYTF